jgi:hypothetical protein
MNCTSFANAPMVTVTIESWYTHRLESPTAIDSTGPSGLWLLWAD